MSEFKNQVRSLRRKFSARGVSVQYEKQITSGKGRVISGGRLRGFTFRLISSFLSGRNDGNRDD
ncbi:hypothetical protein GF108_17825 [Phyllobacterium sp. SYP-B3895]|nr:hypothetical protein [Phyllobacterium sp. SYP-B3895]